MIILAIDPAARTGWALADTIADQLTYGVWALGADPGGQLIRLEEYATATIKRFGVQVVAYESASFGSHNPHVQSRHNEKGAIIQMVAAKHNLPCWSYNPMQWKAIALTSGNLDKAGVMRALKLIYDIEVDDPDEADAIGIAKAATKGPPPESKKKQRRAAEKRLKAMPRLFR